MGDHSSPQNYLQALTTYFQREVAGKAASSLSDGAEIEIRIQSDPVQIYTFTKEKGENQVLPTPSRSPQLTFTVTHHAVEAVLSDPSEDIGAIGVNILKLIVSEDPSIQVKIRFHSGFLGLFSKGYFGVLATGGPPFAAYLASRGLNGMGAIKSALKKMKTE